MLLTVKEYAQQAGKSVQSVYKQLQGKTMREEIKDHLIYQRRGNRNILCLDETAIEMLNASANNTPIIIEQTDMKERLLAYQEQIAKLTERLIVTQEALIAEQNAVKELQARNIALLEQKTEERPKRRWFNFWRNSSDGN